MPISVNENGVVKPLGTNILYERHLRYIPWHTTYQALIGHDCAVGNLDLFCTVDLSFTPDYVLVKRPTKNPIFSQNDSHSTDAKENRWVFWSSPHMTFTDIYHFIILTPVHSRHNMSEEEKDCSFDFAYDITNVSSVDLDLTYVYTGFELVDNTVKCYFYMDSSYRNAIPWINQGIGFGYQTSNNGYAGTDVLELEIEAFGNCQRVSV